MLSLPLRPQVSAEEYHCNLCTVRMGICQVVPRPLTGIGILATRGQAN